MMIRILTCVALTAGAWLTVPLPAQGAESYDNCTGFVSSLPATISTQGTWCLDKDLSTAMTSGSAITIATNNVTLDCNHFKIGGLAAGAGTTTYGVYALTRLNATIRNCNIRGFFTGIHLAGGGGHLVEDNSLDGSTHSGILMAGSASTIRNNLVIDTGGSTAYTGFTIGIRAEEGAAVLDNTVNGVAPIDAALAIGIFSFGGGSISGNRIRGIAGTPVHGIYADSSVRTLIRSNDVQGPGTGVTGGIGIRCFSLGSTAHDNLIDGFETGIDNCLSSSNVVNTQ
jgi:parallel beta-helix repeat protein